MVLRGCPSCCTDCIRLEGRRRHIHDLLACLAAYTALRAHLIWWSVCMRAKLNTDARCPACIAKP